MSALNDLKQSGDLQRKATEFFLSREEDYIFSFRSICDFLSVDPTKVLKVAGIPQAQKSLDLESQGKTS
jgi:hypothetical protein